MTVQTLNLPTLTREAEVKPASFSEADNTIEVVWTTGATVRRSPWFGESYDETLSLEPGHVRLDRLNTNAPFLRNHWNYTEDAIGTVVPGSARIENGVGTAMIRLDPSEASGEVVEKIRNGTIRAVSVGYRVHKYIITENDGAPDEWRAVDWEPYEISAVAIGADPGAGFRGAEEVTPCTVVRAAPAAPQQQDLQTMTVQTQRAADPAPNPTPTVQENTPVTTTTDNRAAQPAPAPQTAPAVDLDGERAAAAKAERERCAGIYKTAEILGVERSVADKLVNDGVSLDAARAAMIDAHAAKADATRTASGVTVPAGGLDETVTRREAAENAILHRYSPGKYSLSDAGREYRGMTLFDVAREMVAARGEQVKGLSRNEIVERSLHSSSDFPAILANVANKALRTAYQEAPATWMPLARRSSASDFKSMHRVQIGEAPRLEKVNESGEFKRGTIGENGESYSIATYGKVIAVTRQLIINDDLGALTRVPELFGRAARQLESDIVWGIILNNVKLSDGKALFHADRKNLAATGAAPDAAAVSKARAAMRQQTGLDGKTVLDIAPAFIIGGTALETHFAKLVAPIFPSTSDAVVPDTIRSLTPVTEPRLDVASGASPWFLSASPAAIDTIEYAYLEGNEGVYIETRQGFDVDGLEIKARLDFGAAPLDYRGFYKNPGVAA